MNNTRRIKKSPLTFVAPIFIKIAFRTDIIFERGKNDVPNQSIDSFFVRILLSSVRYSSLEKFRKFRKWVWITKRGHRNRARKRKEKYSIFTAQVSWKIGAKKILLAFKSIVVAASRFMKFEKKNRRVEERVRHSIMDPLVGLDIFARLHRALRSN